MFGDIGVHASKNAGIERVFKGRTAVVAEIDPGLR
jgi:hypothetical protein